ELPTHVPADLGSQSPGHLAELIRIQENLVDPCPRGLEGDDLMDALRLVRDPRIPLGLRGRGREYREERSHPEGEVSASQELGFHGAVPPGPWVPLDNIKPSC